MGDVWLLKKHCCHQSYCFGLSVHLPALSLCAERERACVFMARVFMCGCTNVRMRFTLSLCVSELFALQGNTMASPPCKVQYKWFQKTEVVQRHCGAAANLPKKAVITFPLIFPLSRSLITYLGENLIDTANWQTHSENLGNQGESIPTR